MTLTRRQARRYPALHPVAVGTSSTKATAAG